MPTFRQMPHGSIIGSGSYVFRHYGSEITEIIDVTCSGTGDSTSCYAIINGTTQTGTYTGTYTGTVNAGDTITFAVKGVSTRTPGEVVINSQSVLQVINNSVATYAWTVPSGITTITITLATKGYIYNKVGTIYVTTS